MRVSIPTWTFVRIRVSCRLEGFPLGERSVQAENGEQRLVDDPLLVGGETTGEVAESTDVDCSNLFDEHLRRRVLEVDLGTERRWSGARRGGRNQHSGPGEESVRLDDDTEAFSLLFVSGASGHAEAEDVTALHAGSPSAEPPRPFRPDLPRRLPRQRLRLPTFAYGEVGMPTQPMHV